MNNIKRQVFYFKVRNFPVILVNDVYDTVAVSFLHFSVVVVHGSFTAMNTMQACTARLFFLTFPRASSHCYQRFAHANLVGK